jgi:hypothetical protein
MSRLGRRGDAGVRRLLLLLGRRGDAGIRRLLLVKQHVL